MMNIKFTCGNHSAVPGTYKPTMMTVMIQVITSVIVIQGFVVHIETFIHNPQRMKIKHI
jgi:hypothetical protein